MFIIITRRNIAIEPFHVARCVFIIISEKIGQVVWIIALIMKKRLIERRNQ